MYQPGHVVPKKTLVVTYFSLIFLTAVMIGLSRLKVENWGIDWMSPRALLGITIMSVSVFMAVIVAMFLMGLKYEHKALNLVIFATNFVFLLIFVLFTWADTSFRGEIYPDFDKKINWESPVKSEPSSEAAPAAEAKP